MSDWVETRLGDIADTTSGGTPDRKNPNYYGGTIPWVKSGELEDSFILETDEQLTTEGLKNSSAKIFPGGTLLMAMYGATVGKTAILKIPAATNQAICAIFPRNGFATTEFVRYALIHQRAEILKQRYGGAQPNISQQIIRNLIIPVPPILEQRKIAAVLGLVQRAIEQQERLIALTTELKKALLHKLFTEGLRGEPQKQTEIGPVPESWKIKKLGALVNLQTGKLNSNAATPNGLYPFFTCSQETFRIDQYAFDTEAILLSGNNAQGIYSVKHYNGKFNAYQRTYVITVKVEGSVPYPFLHQALSRNLERLRNLSIGTSTKYLTLGVLQNLPIPKPGYDEAKHIGDRLQVIDTKIELIARKKDTLADLFRTLLHRLMTAQIRIKDLNVGFFA